MKREFVQPRSRAPCAFTKRAERLESYWGYYGNCN